MKRILAVGVILLFVAIAYAPAIAQNTEKQISVSRGTWLYVGGSGPGNYTRIQDAIDNASDGDTVFVYNGTYFEHVKVNKILDLIGEKRNTTIIDTQGKYSVVINVDTEAMIQGFTVQNAGHGVGIFLLNSGVISNNRIRDCEQGIMIEGGIALCEIHHNLIVNNTDVGISYSYGMAGPCSIHHNYIIANAIGIHGISIFYVEPPELVSVVQNQFEENDLAIQTNNFHAEVSQNNFVKNARQVWLQYGGPLSMLSYVPLCKTQWSQNYWDNWSKETPRPILGLFLIYIVAGWYAFPLFLCPLVQFDKHPAQQPYDIGGI